jgi:hypothetical protein
MGFIAGNHPNNVFGANGGRSYLAALEVRAIRVGYTSVGVPACFFTPSKV